MELYKDFKEFIELLNEHKVSYLVIGGYAVNFHGYPRYTKDIDFKTCYFYNEKLVNEITRRSTCFLSFNRENVKSIFGEPTIVYENKLQYNMSMSCEASDTLIVSPYSLYFKFEGDNVISLQKLRASVIN